MGMAGRLPPAAADALAGPLTDLQAVALEAVAPTFRALVETAEELLLQMHTAPAYSPAGGGSSGEEGGGGEPGVTDTSAFMRGLARHLAHCRLEYLTKFNPSPASPIPSGECDECYAQRLSASVCNGPHHLPSLLLTSLLPSPPLLPPAVARSLVERMAARLVLFAVRHASLLRPLPQSGKLQLAKVGWHGCCEPWRETMASVVGHVGVDSRDVSLVAARCKLPGQPTQPLALLIQLSPPLLLPLATPPAGPC